VKLAEDEIARRAPDLKLLIQLGSEEREERLFFAKQQDLGVEITAFLSGPALNDPVFRAGLERDLAKDLADFPGLISFHGAFLDLAVHSADEIIAATSRRRIECDLITARGLGCRKIIFHLGFNPLIGGRRHRTEFLERHISFWNEIVERHSDFEICLENQWETDPTIFEELFEAVDHPRFGMCLDVAHAHVHSHFAPEAWAERMRPHILHQHWSDNHGDRDRHASLGAGNIDWSPLSVPSVPVTLEMNSVAAVRRSLSFLGQRKLRPTFSSYPTPFEPLLS
jgi:sugar phosphate isomerase/epimerase